LHKISTNFFIHGRIKRKKGFCNRGANGIGKSIVKAFCIEQAKVAFCDIDKEAACILCSELKKYDPQFIFADISDKDEVEKAVSGVINEWGDIDILINNAGVSRFRPIIDLPVEEFDKILDINLRPVFITSKILAIHRERQKEKNRYGRIINIASTRYLMSEPDSEAYAASKGGVVSLTHALAISLSMYGITVNCISPGWIETGDYEKLRAIDHKQHPSGRVGMPDDIARTCVFLCHPDNNFINAQNIIVDGGMTKKMIYEE